MVSMHVYMCRSTHVQMLRLYDNIIMLNFCAYVHYNDSICIMLHTCTSNVITVGPLYYKPLKCRNLCNKDTILCPSAVLKCIE